MSEQQYPDKDAEDTGVIVDKQESRPTRQSRYNKPEKHGLKRSDEPNVSKMDFKNNRRKQSQSKISENKDPKNSDSSGNITNNVINKTSLASKTNPPDSILLESLDAKQKKAAAIPEQLAQVTQVQPISNDIEAVSASPEKPVESEIPADSEKPLKLDTNKSEREAEETSLDEITELRTQPKFSEWVPIATNISEVSSQTTVKKELSWCDDEYLQKVQLKSMGETSRSLGLERKASVGPFKSATPFRRASGLTVCVPKKSSRNISSSDLSAVINISISKKSLPNNKSGVVINSSPDCAKSRGDATRREENRAVKVDIEIPYKRIFNVVRNKLGFIRSKFYSVRNLTS